MKPATALLETAIYAKDIDAAEAFYRDVFGLTVVSKADDRLVFLRCGTQMLLVFNPAFSAHEDPAIAIPRHGATGAGHFCFRAQDATEVGQWRDHFRSLGIAVEHYHIWPNGAHSVYIRDPAGNSVEVGEVKLWDLE
ncbi:VOC family protein [Phaeovulum sp.]|uniref:VOC family protein n=1 Tax=Phaeovulum sp. TaxID=2934796 RepID=UPI0039E68F78